MTDIRTKKLADILVNHSLDVQKNEVISINSDILGMPLVEEVYKRIILKKAHPVVNFESDQLYKILYDRGTKDQIEYISGIDKTIFESDGYLGIYAPEKLGILSECNVDKMILKRKKQKPLREQMLNNSKWCVVYYPTKALAKSARMSFRKYKNFLYNATLIDWPKLSRKQQKMVDFFTNKKHVKIIGKKTDISFNVEGRKWINSDGKHNMPDGEVYTSPIADSVQGSIHINLPTNYLSKYFEDVELVFKDGCVIEANAKKNKKSLNKILDTDKFSRYCGELAFGFNYGIKKVTGDILFDEKIGGTMHIALGFAFKQAGGKIESIIHWDMVRDLNPGIVLVDNKEVYKNGKWFI